MYLLQIIFITYLQNIFAFNIETNIEVVKDVILSYGKPLVPIAFFCNRQDLNTFIIYMSKYGIPSSAYNVSVTILPNPFPPNHALFVLDSQCERTPEFLSKVNSAKLFSAPYRWIIINLYKNEVEGLFKNIDILVDSEVMVFNLLPNDTSTIFNIYKINKNSPITSEDVGIWIKNVGYNFTYLNKMMANRRSDLMRSNLISCLVITHNDSLKHLTDKRDKHIDTIAKVNYIFMLHLGDMFNATMIYTIQSSWGYQNENHEWNGMIGELTRKEADIGGTPLFLTTDRVPIIDYIAMTTPTKSKFVFRQPKLSYITNVFTLPFDNLVWMSCIAMVVTTAFGLYIVTIWEWRNTSVITTNDGSSEAQLPNSLIDVFFLAFGAVCQQGSQVIPYSVPGRIITIVLFVSVMFLYTSYSANIVALLQSSSTSIQTLSDLLHSRLQVGVDDTVFNHFYFPNATEPIRKAIYEQKVAPLGQAPRYFSIEEGVAKLRQGLFAFHMETGAGYKIVAETFFEEEKCGLQEIQYLQVPDPWLAIQKNSSYKEMLKIGLRKIRESGLQSREVSILYTKKPQCSSRGSSFTGVSIVDCYPAAMVFAIGIIASFAIFVIELSYKYRYNLLLALEMRLSKPLPYVE